jgi:tetratricopeptide (TPR) repeat protein
MWLDRLALDYDNFRAAFDWAQAHADGRRALCLGSAYWRFWQMRGHLREGRMRMEAVLAMPTTHEFPKERALALEAAGGIAYWQGDMDYAQAAYDECLALIREHGDERALANAIYNDAFPAMVVRTDVPRALAALKEALPIFKRLGDEPGIARCLWALGQCLMTMNDYPAALSMLGDAIELFRRLDDRFGLGWAYFVRGLLEITLDDLGAAKTDSIDALRIFADANDVTGVVLVLDALAETARRDGDLVRAARLAGASAVHEVAIGAGLATIVALREGWPQGEAESEAEAAARAEGQAMTLPQAIDYALTSEGRITAVG